MLVRGQTQCRAGLLRLSSVGGQIQYSDYSGTGGGKKLMPLRRDITGAGESAQ